MALCAYLIVTTCGLIGAQISSGGFRILSLVVLPIALLAWAANTVYLMYQVGRLTDKLEDSQNENRALIDRITTIDKRLDTLDEKVEHLSTNFLIISRSIPSATERVPDNLQTPVEDETK